jgi:hypothetical protein
MAALTVTQVSTTGVTAPTPAAAAAAGDTFVNNGRTYLQVTNSAETAITVTVNSLTNCNFGTDHDVAVVVNNATRLIGPFPMDRFNSSAGVATVTYSSHTTITIAPISI